MIKDSQVRIWKSLKANPEFSISLNESQKKILEKFMESKIKLVILNIDLVGSTKMSLNLPIDRLTTIIRSIRSRNYHTNIYVWRICFKVYWRCSVSIFCRGQNCNEKLPMIIRTRLIIVVVMTILILFPTVM